MTSDSPRTRLSIKLALSTASVLTTLLVAEVVCRYRAHRLNQDTLQAAYSRPQTFSAGKGEAALGDIIQPSPNDRIAYELRPGLKQVSFKQRPLTTNTAGFRPAELPEAEPPGTVTVLGIGDSIMFGHGVADGECYMDQLEGLLRTRAPEVAWRTLNTAVPGYNTVMEFETLERKGLAFGPDLVVLGLCGNDYGPPTYVRVADDIGDLSRSFLFEFVAERLAGDQPGVHFREQALSHRASWSDATSKRAPLRYAELYGEEAFLSALERLTELSRRHGFEVLAIAVNEFPPAPDMLEACRAQGFHVTSTQPYVDRETETQTGAPFTWEAMFRTDLVVNRKNGHPSVKLHGVVAPELLSVIEAQGLLEVLVDRQ